MPTKFLHFDTYFADYLTNTQNTATTRPNPYEVQFTLPAQIRNVRRVALKSAEVPVSFGQTRGAVVQSSCAGYYAVKINGTRYEFTMSSRTYSSITSFITDFQTEWDAFVGTPSGKGGTLSVITEVGASGNQHFLLFTFPTSTTVEFVDGVLSRSIMGFKSSIDSATGTGIGASGRFNLNADNFLAMYIKDIPNSSTSVSSKPCTFKIPLNAGYGNVCYYSDGAGFAQWVDVPAHYNYNMDRLTVSIYDRWGYQINPWGGDYTFTLAIDYDE
jgi:hypothetical protein